MPSLHPFFMPVDGADRFCILHEPDSHASFRGAVVFVHPFAEEMNKSRRMAALQSRAFAAAGWAVLQIDLYGCGDSAGDFGDASWSRWVDDVTFAFDWLRTRTHCTPALWALRAGVLIAAEAARSIQPAPDLVLWQPSLSGKQVLQQFLRVDVAGQMIAGGDGNTGTAALRARLASGDAIEVAGYRLTSALTSGMEGAELRAPAQPVRVAWLELNASGETELSPGARSRAASWQNAGHTLRMRAVQGAAFWQTQEITECHALVEATLACLGEFAA